MKGFIKNVLSSALGVILASFMLIGTIIILIVISGLINTLFNEDGKIDENSIVKIKFDYPIYDKANTDPFMNFSPFGEFEPNNSQNLYKILNSIKVATHNNNVAGIFLDLTSFQSPGQASVKEIRDALKLFKESGKFIYSYANYFGKTAYYLASISDSIFMYPTGALELSGLSSTIPFFTETMQEIGVKPEIIRHGKFKAAIEPFMLTEMSSENREQTEMLLNDLWLNMLQDISEERNLSIDSLNNIADNIILSMLPTKPLETGLIDKLLYPDEFKALLAEKINIKKIDDINFVTIGDLKEKKNKSKNKIAIIYAEGNIDGDQKNIHSGYTKTIKKVLKDDDVNAVVFRVNSPGGSALISDEILSQMKLAKKEKPIVVSMGNYAASGGYYISCAADKILASPNTITGSIGVFGLFFTAEELLTEKMKLHFDNVKTNKFSNMGSLHRSLSNEERESLQISVKNTYQEFITHVAHARNMDTEEVDMIGQGRVWTGIRAKEIGLVDEMGGLSDAIQLASKLAEINDFQIEEFPKTNNGIEAFLNSIEETKHLSNQKIDALYLEKIKKEFLDMQGIQALLPIKYDLK
mgnify:CR=1 FL=1|tara:strand:- start:8300 stop:10048 length:1749 start_codon:yes stop_codon:yes gene_type:complete